MKKLALVVTLGLLSFSSFAHAGDDKDDDKENRLSTIIESLQQQVDMLELRLYALEQQPITVAQTPASPVLNATPVVTTPTTIMANGVSLGSFVSMDANGNYMGVDKNGVSFTVGANGNYINNTYRVGFVTPDCTVEVYFMPTGNFPNGTKARFQDIAGNEYNSVGNGTFTFTRSEYDQFGNCVQTPVKVMQNAQRATRALPTTIVPPVTVQ